MLVAFLRQEGEAHMLAVNFRFLLRYHIVLLSSTLNEGNARIEQI